MLKKANQSLFGLRGKQNQCQEKPKKSEGQCTVQGHNHHRRLHGGRTKNYEKDVRRNQNQKFTGAS